MKKQSMLILASLSMLTLLFSCKCKPCTASNTIRKSTTISPPPPGHVYKTLNGVFEGEAATKIFNYAYDDNYLNDINRKKSVNAWYSKEQLSLILSAINSESSFAGIRFYFGADENPAGTSGTKLTLHLYMVSTRKRLSTDPVGGGSDYIDYFDHTAAYLTAAGSTVFGDAVNDNAADAANHGATLYGNPNTTSGGFPPGVCNNGDPHYIDNQTALDWVQMRGHNATAGSDPSGINTKSEWFDGPFIKNLFSILITKGLGLRVYLGKGFTDQTGQRDVLILVPTIDHANGDHFDDYECLTGFSNFPLMKDNTLVSDDKGELCPYTCN